MRGKMLEYYNKLAKTLPDPGITITWTQWSITDEGVMCKVCEEPICPCPGETKEDISYMSEQIVDHLKENPACNPYE